MSSVFNDTFLIYSRNLRQAIDGLPKTSKEFRKLKAVAEALNLDVSEKLDDKALVEILARLRTLVLVDLPPY